MKKTTRTPQEIANQIDGLKRSKETLPEFSNFGDNNYEAIDAQLDILEGLKTPDDFYKEEGDEDFRDGDNYVYNAAIDAENWLNSNTKEDLF